MATCKTNFLQEEMKRSKFIVCRHKEIISVNFNSDKQCQNARMSEDRKEQDRQTDKIYGNLTEYIKK